jgi:broad specificity polyphosphatase/5'/3'-nucleotidase SurE
MKKIKQNIIVKSDLFADLNKKESEKNINIPNIETEKKASVNITQTQNKVEIVLKEKNATITSKYKYEHSPELLYRISTLDEYEYNERAAIIEYDGNIDKMTAEILACEELYND